MLQDVEAAFEELAFHKALIAIWDFINIANKYIVTNEPWTLAKDPANADRLKTVVYNLLESLRIVAVLIAPFMPGTSKTILSRIGLGDSDSQSCDTIRSWGGLPAGNIVDKGEALFPRVEFKKEAAEVKKLDTKPEITYEDFQKVDLRAARILEAERVPKSDKLIKLKLDIGEDRTIVAGIGKDYKPEELVGKSIVVVANLKPAKLMGVESRGMLLATSGKDGLTLLGFDRDAEPGKAIK